MTDSHKSYRADYAVVGSGIAGLRAAIELSKAGSVLVLAKSNLSDSATAWAQGGIAVALSDEDEIGLHEQDTINAGDGLCRPEAVTRVVEEGPKYITQLIAWGTEFDRAGTKLAFTRETAWPSLTKQARCCPTWSSCNSIQRRWRSRARRAFYCPKRCAAKAGCCAISASNDS